MEFFADLMEGVIYLIYAIITAIVGAIVMLINRKRIRNRMEPLDHNDHKQKRKKNYTRSLIVDEQITARIKEDDENFDEQAFKEWAKETFVEFQKAWTKKDLNLIRSRLDSNLYEQYKLLLDVNVEQNCTEVIDIKQINYVDFSAYSEDNEKEIIEVAINVVMYKYTINNETNNLVAGSKNIKERVTYKMKFYRKLGSQTDESNEYTSCPNCGAKILKKQNKCEYCKTWILEGVKEWILNNIERY